MKLLSRVGNRNTELMVYTKLLPPCSPWCGGGTLAKALNVRWVCVALACVPYKALSFVILCVKLYFQFIVGKGSIQKPILHLYAYQLHIHFKLTRKHGVLYFPTVHHLEVSTLNGNGCVG